MQKPEMRTYKGLHTLIIESGHLNACCQGWCERGLRPNQHNPNGTFKKEKKYIEKSKNQVMFLHMTE